ncbi:hypothetical protein PVC01_000023400 [Plasmodium vivax]|uniref:VIR protein n=2 Tax=Plasmodium vivax TaxID=5855 RepID=A0A1G4E9H7_PLAVI|nr:hypothetical protein PVC01_000023400 [Plasmodium vivax]
MSNYHQCKTEIEQKINTFRFNNSNLLCIKCNELKNDIIQRSNGLQHCYKSSRLQRIESIDNIKEFISKCPDLPNCSYPPKKSDSKPVVSKGPKKGSCTGYENCKEKTVIPDEQKSSAPPGITARNSQTRRSEEKASLKQDRGHSDGDKLSDGKVISQTTPEVNPPSDPVRTQDEGSKSTVNLPSASTEETDTPMQYVSSPSPSTSVELGTPPSALSSQNSDTIDSHSSSSTQVEGLNKGVPATNIAVVQTERVNQIQNIPVDAQNNQGLAHDNAHAIEASAERVSASNSFRGDKADYRGPRFEGPSDGVTSDQIGHAHVDQGNTDSTGSQIIVAHSGDLGGRD